MPYKLLRSSVSLRGRAGAVRGLVGALDSVRSNGSFNEWRADLADMLTAFAPLLPALTGAVAENSTSRNMRLALLVPATPGTEVVLLKADRDARWLALVSRLEDALDVDLTALPVVAPVTVVPVILLAVVDVRPYTAPGSARYIVAPGRRDRRGRALIEDCVSCKYRGNADFGASFPDGSWSSSSS